MQRLFKQPLFVGARALITSFALVSAASATDTIAPGFGLELTHPYPVFDAYATLSNTNRVTFDGFTFAIETEDGATVTQLAQLTQSVFASLVAIDPSETYAICGESSNGFLYKVDLVHGGAVPLVHLDNNFDVRFEDASHLIVSAATCGFGCGNSIYRVDVNSGVATLLANLIGPSGPIDIAPNGDLYYCTQDTAFPPAPGSSSIIRWTSAEIHSGVTLTAADADVFIANLDGGSSIRFERIFGHLFVCETPFGLPTKLIEFDEAGAHVNDVVTTPDTVSSIEFHYGTGAASFQAFQPANVTLNYRSTDYNLFTGVIQKVTPKRPIAIASGPGTMGPGFLTVTVTGAYPNSSCFVLSGPRATYNPIETAYDLGPYLFHTGIPFNQIRRAGIQFTTDASGTGSFTFFNSSALIGTRVIQPLVRDGVGAFVGSSNAVFN